MLELSKFQDQLGQEFSLRMPNVGIQKQSFALD